MRMRAAATGMLALLVILLCSPIPARAERIRLKNGRTVEGWIVEENKAQIVVAIIRDATVGQLIIDATQVEEIDRRRFESLEEALARARAEREARERERRSGLPAVPTATAAAAEPQPAREPGAGATPPEQRAAGASQAESTEQLFPPLTEEEQARVAQLIESLGDTRRAGGAATRRENAETALVEMGIRVIPALTEALGDQANVYRRMNAAQAIGRIAEKDRRLELYREAISQLMKLLQDTHPWVRIAANGALEQISGQRFGYPKEPLSWETIAAPERAAFEKWQAWWREQRR
ncbi:MAG: hypothetical protein KatS3mg102_2562 [Planctomycetota bacterium]|nr:MAG: hypothetical protein KatS3mg102_2562 [Planctomycetota bacterium]